MKEKLFFLPQVIAVFAVVAGCTPGSIAQVNTPIPSSQAGTPAPNGQLNVPGISLQVNAPGPNPLADTADAHGRVAGISLGLWHGLISPVTLVLSFTNNGAQMYEVHNDGGEYNLGFLLGVAIVFVILGAGVGSRRR